jgi:hypothetical protein
VYKLRGMGYLHREDIIRFSRSCLEVYFISSFLKKRLPDICLKASSIRKGNAGNVEPTACFVDF